MATMTAVTEPVTAPKAVRARRRLPRVSVWALLTTIAGGASLIEVVGPLNDPDIWWHVRTGELILDTGAVPHTEPWAFAAIGRPWVPNAWLSDTLLALGYRAGGWSAVTFMFLVASGLVLALLGWQLHRDHSGPIAFAVFVVTTASILIFLAERPQVVSLAFTVWLVAVCRRLMKGEEIRLPVFLALVYLWANLHGMWVLAPLTVTLAFLASLAADRRRALHRWPHVTAMVLGSFLVAALTPVGPRLAVWWFVVRKAAAGTTEWQPTVLWNHQSVWLIGLVLMIFVSWVFAARRPDPSEGIWVLGIFLFALSAGRNIAPSSLLLAPFAADALDRLRTAGPTSRRRWPVVPAWSLAVPVAVFTALFSTLIATVPRLPDDLPLRLVAELNSEPHQRVRVLNDFNIGGLLTGLGAPRISVALDGRIDNYDVTYTDEYWSVERGTHLDTFLDRYHPDAAALEEDSPLIPMLKAENWSQVLTDHGWVLLKPPPAR
jgi:hypothetical protein